MLVTTSWDDGYPSDLRVADLLEKHGLRGTFYVPTANSEGRRVMSSPEIIELGRRFEIGGHTRDHVSLTDMAPRQAADQIATNKHRLEDLLGQEVRGFAYVRGRHNRVVRDLVDQAGYHYARTVKNLMTVPGSDRLQLPTTIQFYAHSKSTYLQNYVSGGPSLQRSAILAAVLFDDDLPRRLSRAAEVCARSGRYFHLWGHSWELDAHDLWQDLDRLFARLRAFDARFVANADCCVGLAPSAAARTPIAPGWKSEELT